MTNQSQPESNDALEAALGRLYANRDNVDPEVPRDVLKILATSRIFVILDTAPPADPEEEFDAMPLHVSDGPDMNQPMLALFSQRSHAEYFLGQHEPDNWKYIYEVFAPQALLNAAQGAGIIVNPNHELGFRVGPDLTAALCLDIKSAIETARNTASGRPD